MHWVEAYYYSSGEFGFPENISNLLLILDEHEKTRLARFAFEHLKWTFVTARWIAKTAVAEKVKCQPSEIVLHYNENGKPLLDTLFGIDISISHTDKGIAVALSNASVGIDLECHKRRGDPWRQAELYLNPYVANVLDGLESDKQKEQGFSRYWTAMESFVKRKGSSIFQEKAQFGKTIDPMIKDGCYKSESAHWYTQSVGADAQLTLCTSALDHTLRSYVFDGKDFQNSPIFAN